MITHKHFLYSITINLNGMSLKVTAQHFGYYNERANFVSQDGVGIGYSTINFKY